MDGRAKEYVGLAEMKEDYLLLQEANKRMKENSAKATLLFEAVMKDLAVSEEEIADVEDVNIE